MTEDDHKARAMKVHWDEVNRLLSEAGVLDKVSDLKDLYTENESFKALCQHYLDCHNALQQWNGTDVPELADRRREYSDIKKEMEDEIVSFILSYRRCR